MIDILISTYNGKLFLLELLNSLFSQSCQDFKLLIRDDLSTDNTLEIIHEYILKYPNKIQLIDDNFGNLGSAKSFMKLLEYSDNEYIMLCDQDDVWMKDKIKLTLQEMLKIEKQTSKTTPLLVFTDLTVVDTSLNTINKSFWKYQKLLPEISSNWKKLLVQNVVTGCTIMINKKTKDICLPFSISMMPHDKWIGVNVAKYGKVSYIDVQTIFYRQHINNVEGASRYNYLHIFSKLKTIKLFYNSFSRYSNHFKDVTVVELFVYLVNINLKRIIS